MPQPQLPPQPQPPPPADMLLCPPPELTAAKTERTRRVSVCAQVGQATPPSAFSGVAWRISFSNRSLQSGQKYSYIGIGLPLSFLQRDIGVSVATTKNIRQQIRSIF